MDTHETTAATAPIVPSPGLMSRHMVRRGDAALKIAELDLALASLDIEADGFEPAVRRACAECGFVFLFNLPVPEPGNTQRVAAAAWPQERGTGARPALAFIMLDRAGTGVAVADSCDALPHAGAVADAWFDLMVN